MKLSLFKIASLVVAVAFVSFFLNVLFADSLLARISTWHWVQKYHLISPRAPLVINRTEEVRVSDGNDSIAAVNKTKSKIVAVADVSSGFPVLRGAGVAVTSDGNFLTVTAAVQGLKQGSLVVITSEGKRHSVTSVKSDAMTGLVVLGTSAVSSAASFASSDDLRAATRVVLLGALLDGSPYALSSFFSSGLIPVGGVVSSDVYTSAVAFQQQDGAVPGQVAINFDGEVAGIWDGQKVIAPTVLQSVIGNFLANNGKFSHPVFGFYYRIVSAQDAAESKGIAGLLVTRQPDGKTAVVSASPAAKAGLIEGDVITSIDGQGVLDGQVDVRLQALKGQTRFTVVRSGQERVVQITPEIQ